MTDRAAWEKLGVLLRARRVDGLGYKKRAQFARDRGIHERTAYNLEEAKRDSYADGTFALAEEAYGWAPKSISRFLADGTPPAQILDAGLLDGLDEEDERIVRDFIAWRRKRAEERRRHSG
jgi:hypothetical protein